MSEAWEIALRQQAAVRGFEVRRSRRAADRGRPFSICDRGTGAILMRAVPADLRALEAALDQLAHVHGRRPVRRRVAA